LSFQRSTCMDPTGRKKYDLVLDKIKDL